MIRTKPPKIAINACPWCSKAFNATPSFDAVTAIGCCTDCGELVAVRHMGAGRVEVGTFSHEWLCRNFDEAARKRIHAAQEKILFDIGLYG